MEQFSLEKYLKNPNRKVVTRRGNPVRIICTDRKHGEDTLPIVFLEESPDGIGEFLLSCRADGTCDNYDTPYDLFFADEEDELTEFEARIYNLINFSDPYNYPSIKEVKEEAEILLDLARKELEANYYTKVLDDKVVFKSDLHDRDMQGAYELGKQDALKDLPKWKKAEKDEELDCHVAIQQNDRVVLSDFVQKDEYYITLNVLKKLPKEE